jgi:hypothetical protein
VSRSVIPLGEVAGRLEIRPRLVLAGAGRVDQPRIDVFQHVAAAPAVLVPRSAACRVC